MIKWFNFPGVKFQIHQGPETPLNLKTERKNLNEDMVVPDPQPEEIPDGVIFE